jgi:ATP-dependent Lhr-like helicase
VLECEAALEAVAENAQDTEYPMVLKLDVLAQHILGRAVAGPFDAAHSVRARSHPLSPSATCRAEDFDQTLDYVGNRWLRAQIL